MVNPDFVEPTPDERAALESERAAHEAVNAETFLCVTAFYTPGIIGAFHFASYDQARAWFDCASADCPASYRSVTLHRQIIGGVFTTMAVTVVPNLD